MNDFAKISINATLSANYYGFTRRTLFMTDI